MSESSPDLLGKFIRLWSFVEGGLRSLAEHYSDYAEGEIRFHSSRNYIEILRSAGRLDKEKVELFERLKNLRNKVVHGELEPSAVSPQVIADLERLAEWLEDEGKIVC